MTEPAPWTVGSSILEVLRAAGPDAGSTELPDEPPRDPSRIRFSGGSLDGVLGHHGGDFADLQTRRQRRLRRLVRWRSRPTPLLLSELMRLVEEDDHASRIALYRSAERDELLGSIDEVIELVIRSAGPRSSIAEHARWLVDEGRHRGPVKLGVALLGVAGTEADDLDRLSVLARHGEFGLYCAVAFQNLLEDPVDGLWTMAQVTDGWGKIQAVERLAPFARDRPDVQRWLLTSGCQNSVMNEYLAYTCAEAGQLAEALATDPDDDIIDGAGPIFSALCAGGPAEDMHDYAAAPAAVSAYLRELRTRCDRLERLDAVVDLGRWLHDESGDDGRWGEAAELMAICAEITDDPV